MFKYKEKTAFTYNIQSVVSEMNYTVSSGTLNSTIPYLVVHCRKFPFKPLEKCMTFKDISPELSRTLSFNFQDFQDQSDFPGLSRSWNFQEKNPGLSSRRGNPVICSEDNTLMNNIG